MKKHFNKGSFQTKLWFWFIVFTAIIFSVLWLLQTVFLQWFYNGMLIDNTRKAAGTIVENADTDSITDIIDQAASGNSLLIYVTDTDGSILYCSDAYKKVRSGDGNGNGNGNGNGSGNGNGNGLGSGNGNRNGSGNGNGNGYGNGNGLGSGSGNGSGKREPQTSNYRSLPEDYDTFLELLKSSESGSTEYKSENLYAYGTWLESSGEESPSILYVSTPLNAVGSAVTILRIQLAIVTVFSLITGFILAWIIARRFAQPVSSIMQKARNLGEKEYTDTFRKRFCNELDELSDTLDRTSERLIRADNFQTEFLANISHDLRTPLTMIRGYAEEVGEYTWQDDQERMHDVGIIIRKADRLTALVNEILEYSELRQERGRESFESVDLSALVNSTADQFDGLFTRQGGNFEGNIQPGLFVKGDPVMLGLPIVKQIIEKHGGSCAVTSSEAEGSCFTISLPPES